MTGNADRLRALCIQLRACEVELLDPAVRQDRARVSELLAEDFEEFGSSGKAWSRNEILDLLASENYTPPAIEDFQCRSIADGVALVTYRTVRTDPITSQPSSVLRSSLWIAQSGRWRICFHQGTKSP
jgi:hypothetical protein